MKFVRGNYAGVRMVKRLVTARRSRSILLSVFLLFASTASFAQTGRILDRLPFEVVMDIVWQGKEIQIRKVLSCDLRRRMHPGNITSVDPGLKLRNVWEQSVNRFYHVFPSGEVLIVVPPHQCNTFNKWLDPLPDGYLPITYWVDNADSPQVVEDISSYLYYKNPRRRFEMRRFQQIEAKHLADRIDDDERLADLVRSRLTYFDALFVGLSVVAFPKSVWERYPALAAELSKRTETAGVERELVHRTALPLLGFCESSAQGIGPAERCLTGPLDTRPYAFPASLQDGVWRIHFDEPGVHRYLRYASVAELERRGCLPNFYECKAARETYRIELDGSVFDYELGKGTFFDVKRQMLVRIGVGRWLSTFHRETGK
jgi:hypothetical protein